MFLIQEKDEFTSYLEKSGVAENLIEVLGYLYDEDNKPKFPTDYIKANLKSTSASESEAIAQNNKLRNENKQLKLKIIEIEKNIEKVKKEIEEKQAKP